DRELEGLVEKRELCEVADAQVACETVLCEAPAGILDCRLAGVDARDRESLAGGEPEIRGAAAADLQDAHLLAPPVTGRVAEHEADDGVPRIARQVRACTLQLRPDVVEGDGCVHARVMVYPAYALRSRGLE